MYVLYKHQLWKDTCLTRVDLTDDVGLGGAFCVWLSQERRMWLNGRLVSARWDVEELLEKKNVIEEQDLLKFGFRLGDIRLQA